MMRKITSLLCGIICCLCPLFAWGQRHSLMVYTAVEPNLLHRYKEAFQKQYPDIQLHFVRDSASPIIARILAEKEHPQADVVLAVSVIALEKLSAQNLLQKIPSAQDQLAPVWKAPKSDWYPVNAWGAAIVVNTDLLKKYNLPIPQSWRDLANPIYKNHIAMPHPISSSTGYMILLGWINLYKNDVWTFMKDIHPNILTYTFSGSRPISMVAQGEIAIGISSAAFANPFMKDYIPMQIIEPKEGLAWDAEGCAVLASSPKKELTQKFIEFCKSPAVAEIARDFSGISPVAGYSSPAGEKTKALFLPINFSEASAQKSEILRLWQKTIGEK